MEGLLRWREPVAFVLAGLLALRTAVLLAVFAVSLGSGEQGAGPSSRLGLAAATYGPRLADPLLIVVLTTAALLCARPATPRSRRVSMLALVVCGISVLGSAALAVIDLALGGGLAYGVLFRLALPALAVVLLAKLARAHSGTGSRSAPPPSPRSSGGQSDLPAEAAGEPPEEPREDGNEQPIWQPDVAAGAAWPSASAAASGAAATGWGRPGETGGWDPHPRASTQPGIIESQASRGSHESQATQPDEQ